MSFLDIKIFIYLISIIAVLHVAISAVQIYQKQVELQLKKKLVELEEKNYKSRGGAYGIN